MGNQISVAHIFSSPSTLFLGNIFSQGSLWTRLLFLYSIPLYITVYLEAPLVYLKSTLNTSDLKLKSHSSPIPILRYPLFTQIVAAPANQPGKPRTPTLTFSLLHTLYSYCHQIVSFTSQIINFSLSLHLHCNQAPSPT